MGDSKLPLSGGMKVRAYQVLLRAVHEGVGYGYQRAYKYAEEPDEGELRDTISEAVISEICEYFDFEEDA